MNLIFTGDRPTQILRGTKTQTRRLLKVEPPLGELGDIEQHPLFDNEWFWWVDGEQSESFTCPFGEVGDKIWVREGWSVWRMGGYWEPDDCDEVEGPIDHDTFEESGYELFYRSDDDTGIDRWRSPIYMPKWASRITLQLTDVRVERLRDISEEDAEAEGAPKGNSHRVYPSSQAAWVQTYRAGFRQLWYSIHKKQETSPWLWALTFKVVP